MKKIISLVLAFVLVLSFASCMKVNITLPEKNIGVDTGAVENTTAAIKVCHFLFIVKTRPFSMKLLLYFHFTEFYSLFAIVQKSHRSLLCHFY